MSVSVAVLKVAVINFESTLKPVNISRDHFGRTAETSCFSITGAFRSDMFGPVAHFKISLFLHFVFEV